jgi:cytoskeletal protein RodZ
MNNDFHSSSRSSYRAKRKKTNIILNSLIVVVILLIAFVAYTIFLSGHDNASPKKNGDSQSLHKDKNDVKDQEADKNTDSETASEDSEQGDNTATDDSSVNENSDESTEATTDSDSSDVQNTVENPDWEPAGTTQSGEHTANYDSNSSDWQEMLSAISSATGLEQSDMTVWFLGRDKNTTDGSVGTVSSKDKQKKFRVYIQWVDGQGWKPTKMEELSEIDTGN